MTVSKILAAARNATTPEARLAALLDAWRATKLPEIATVIEKLGAQLAAARPRLPGKTLDARHAAWFALATKPDPANIGLLLSDPSVLAEHSYGSQWGRTLHRKLVAIGTWPADPRVARALGAALREWVGFSDYATLALRALSRIGDPRSLVGVRGLRDRKKIKAKAEADKAVAALAKVKPARADAETRKVLRELASIGKGKRKTEAALLAAIYADPADDGARLVYGDALQERGDPRGEYIVLAVRHARGELDAPGRGRMRKLLAANKAKWSKPLEPALAHGGAKEFRRGFLSRAKVTGVPMVGESKIRAIYNHPAWALVDEVEFSAPGLEFRAPLVAHLRKLGVAIKVV